MWKPPDARNGRFRNWARNVSSRPSRFVQPADEDEVRALVRDASAAGERVKVVGAGHSWSDIAATDGILLSLDRMQRVIAAERATGLVTVEAGIRIAALNDALETHGLALPVVGSIAEQSIAGATATGTHGSAPGVGILADAIVAMRLVVADGSVRVLSRTSEPELFDAARVGLGALGVVTEVTLRCVPAFRLEEVAQPVPFDEAIREIPSLVSREAFAKVWWLPGSKTAQVFRYTRTEAAPTLSAFATWLDERVINRFVFAFILWLGSTVPALMGLLNRVVGAAYFVPRRRIGRSDRVLTLAMPPRHREVEYALPLERAAEAFRWTRELVTREGLKVDFILELRFVKADDAWMSPAFGRDTCFIGAYAANSPDRERYFAAFERQMLAWGGRPHWGKQFAATRAELVGACPNLLRFGSIRRELDPAGTFTNPFLERVLGTDARATRSDAA